MLSLTIFAAAASAATQPAPATAEAPRERPTAGRQEGRTVASHPSLERDATLWTFADPDVDGGQIWL